MKSKPIDNSFVDSRYIEKYGKEYAPIMQTVEHQLYKQFATGMSYGTKITASVIADKITEYETRTAGKIEGTIEATAELIEDIKRFCQVTDSASPEELNKNYERLVNKREKLAESIKIIENSIEEKENKNE